MHTSQLLFGVTPPLPTSTSGHADRESPPTLLATADAAERNHQIGIVLLWLETAGHLLKDSDICTGVSQARMLQRHDNASHCVHSKRSCSVNS
jgi:hypothetical protein